MAKFGIGDVHQRLLGTEGDPQSGFRDHQLVVRAVADRQHVSRLKPKLVPQCE